MGLTKRLWMDQLAKGYTAPAGRFVCQSCVTDQCLSEKLDAASEEVCCSYCDSESAAPISVLIEEIIDAIREDYNDPADELPYDSKEGGWQGTVYDNWEILDQLDYWSDRDDLTTDVAVSLSEREWCKENYFGLDKFEALDYGWERFKHQIIHRTRCSTQLSGRGPPSRKHSIPNAEILMSLQSLWLRLEPQELWCCWILSSFRHCRAALITRSDTREKLSDFFGASEMISRNRLTKMEESTLSTFPHRSSRNMFVIGSSMEARRSVTLTV